MPNIRTFRNCEALASLRGPMRRGNRGDFLSLRGLKGRSNLPGTASHSKDCFTAARLAMTESQHTAREIRNGD